MAGKRQHYVPKLLQRGFLHDPFEDAERTWLHRRDSDARLVGIRDVGVEDWFYSRISLDGVATLDDAITDIERDLAASIEQMRASTPGSSVDAEEAACTVIHLVMRTAHLRRIVAVCMTNMGNELKSMFTDPARLSELFGLTGNEPVTAVSKLIRNTAEELVPAGFPIDFTERFIAFEMRELGEPLVEQAIANLDPLFPQLISGLSDKVRDAHNEILATSPESDGWINSLANFEWNVMADVDLILPDAVALAREDNGPLMPLLFTSAADVRAVVMPLSPDRMLVGRLADGVPNDPCDFNMHAAACCEDFFIGAKPYDEEKLNTLIGTASYEAIEETISLVVREAEQTRSKVSTETEPVQPCAFEQQEFSYGVRLAGFGDEKLAKVFADVLNVVVGWLSRDIPLHNLDGFTLAADYHDALATVDRGDPDLPPAASSAFSYGQGVAKSVTVVRDGTLKEHLIFEAGLAEMWLSPDAKERATGLQTLVVMLARVAHSTRYAGERVIEFTLGAMETELYDAVASTPANYWCARKAAYVAPNHGNVYADLIIDGLDFASREIAKERERNPENDDNSVIMTRALECVSAVLVHAAEWLGHCDGLLEGQSFVGNDLHERLQARGLDRWIELFGRDLAACYDMDDALNLEVVTRLSSHVERLFWSFGIYCWLEGDEAHCNITDELFFPPQLPP